MTPELFLRSHCHQVETGVIDLNPPFDAHTPSPLTLLILACLKSAVTISKDNVIMNYAS